MARKEREAPRPKWDVRHKKADTPEELSLQIIGALPGVGYNRARSLLDHFGSLQSLFQADWKELHQVPGIGKTGAKKLADLFQADLSTDNIDDPFANPDWGFLQNK
jgi:ERCC4-type nuclease